MIREFKLSDEKKWEAFYPRYVDFFEVTKNLVGFSRN